MALGLYTGAGSPPDLPHPSISISNFLVVENGIRAAWETLRNSPPPGFDLLVEDEDVVTHALYKRLYNEVFNKNVVPGFDRQLLTTITRESKVSNYNGENLDLMPDLIFGLVNRLNVGDQSQDWLFVECKPVDSDHSVGKHYCGKGIIRFVRGDYAWTMTSALMVGYSRTGYTIVPKLGDALKARLATIATLDYPYKCTRSKPGPSNDAVYISRHASAFTYVETTRPAGPIIIRHLWLKRD